VVIPVHNSSDIQVVHISTGYNGGAALSARRLNESLNFLGFESYFGAISQKGYSPSTHEFEISRSTLGRIISGILTRIQLNLSKKVFFSLFSLDILPKKYITSRGNKNNTILHFHNWYNLISQKEIVRWANRGYKVIVTMHDQRMMTGGCHYAFTCKGLYSNCEFCPGLSRIIKRIPKRNVEKFSKELTRLHGNITFISPSRWLDSEAKSSYLLRNQQTVFIPNTFGKAPSPNLKSSFITATNSLNVGIASMEPNSYIKGGDITSSLENLIQNRQIPVIFHKMRNFPQNAKGIQNFWSTIDYLLVISRADNSPNVIHEAKQFGIPVIASKVGGITELLDPRFDFGIELGECNESNLLELLIGLIGKELDPGARAKMQSKYYEYLNNSTVQHIDLYKKLLSESRD
jgi:glycosyltransferase involved in cell wall biosynthesis